MLAAAIELLHDGAIDMHGVVAGDLAEMTARARAALIRAADVEMPDTRVMLGGEPSGAVVAYNSDAKG